MVPIIGTCTAPGCTTFTIGRRCLAHDEKVALEFVRGRPFVRLPLPPQLKVTSAPLYDLAPRLQSEAPEPRRGQPTRRNRPFVTTASVFPSHS